MSVTVLFTSISICFYTNMILPPSSSSPRSEILLPAPILHPMQ
jgi:hypothetical protein